MDDDVLSTALDTLRPVLDVLIDEVDGHGGCQAVLGRHLTHLQQIHELLIPAQEEPVALKSSTARGDQSRRRAVQVVLDQSEPFVVGDPSVKPVGVDAVGDKVTGLQHGGDVLHSRADVSPDLQLLQCDQHGSTSTLTVDSSSKDVAELGISEFVYQSAVVHREVSPNIDGGVEVKLGDATGRGLEPGCGVLCGDSDGDAVAGIGHPLRVLEVDGVLAQDVSAVQPADVSYAVQGQTHGYHQLAGGQVQPEDVLGHRMLHLQSGIELQEGELLRVLQIEVLHGTRVAVAHRLGQRHSCLLHASEGVLGSSRWRTFLDDLLVPALHAAVAAAESDGIPMLVR